MRVVRHARAQVRLAQAVHHQALLHHREVVAQLRHHGEVVAHQHAGQLARGGQVGQQVQHLRLHRHVQRRGRLVEQQHRRARDQRPGDGHALPLPARELVREAEARGAGQRHLVQRAGDARLGPADAVHQQRLGQDAVHGLARVQRAVGVLEHHLHRAVKGAVAPAAQRAAVEQHVARPALALAARHQPGQGAQHGGLARAAFPHQPEGGAARHPEGHAAHRVRGPEADVQPGDLDHRRGRAHSSHAGSLDSVGSRPRGADSAGMQASSPRV